MFDWVVAEEVNAHSFHSARNSLRAKSDLSQPPILLFKLNNKDTNFMRLVGNSVEEGGGDAADWFASRGIVQHEDVF